MYNYKGGVGKTTIAVNLTATLARQGRRTLLVDCDPQSNATSFYLGSTQTEDSDELPLPNRPEGLLYSDSHEMTEEDSAESDDESTEFEIWNNPGIKVESQPTVGLLSDNLPCLGITDVNLADMRSRYEPTVYEHLCLAMRGAISSGTKLAVRSVRGFDNLWILPGDPRLVKLEANFMDAVNFHGLFFIYGLAGFRHMINHIAKDHKIEYVIVDLGPSAGAINQVIILNCDYILPPVMADYFSVCSIDGLLNTLLPHWLDFLRRYRREIRNRQPDTEDNFKYAKFGAPPKILPFLLNGYPMKGGRMVKNYAVWSQTMNNFLEGPNSTVTPRVKGLLTRDGHGKVLVNFCKNLVSVMRISEALRKPIVIMERGDVQKLDDVQKQTNHAKVRYRSLGEFIQQLA